LSKKAADTKGNEPTGKKKPKKIGPPRGRVPGVPVPSSAKTIAANRVRALKHGMRSETMSRAQVIKEKLNRDSGSGRLGDLVETYAAVILEDNADASAELAILASAGTEDLRLTISETIAKDGPIIEKPIIGKDENGDEVLIATMRVAHPGLDPLIRLNEAQGFTAKQLQITRESKGEAKKNDAQARFLARQAILLGEDLNSLEVPGASRKTA
jgi:hypothetical protein